MGQLLTVKEAAQKFGVSENGIRTYVRRGLLKYVDKVGRICYLDEDEVSKTVKKKTTDFPADKWCKVDDAMHYLGVSHTTIHNYISKGAIVAEMVIDPDTGKRCSIINRESMEKYARFVSQRASEVKGRACERVTFPESVSEFINNLVDSERFMSKTSLAKFIKSKYDTNGKLSSISWATYILNCNCPTAEYEIIFKAICDLGYKEPETVTDVPQIKEVVTAPTAPNPKEMTQREMFEFLQNLTPSMTLYFTMLITNDFFYKQEERKYCNN